MHKYLTVVLLVLLPLCASGQGRVYTRKAKLADFTSKITKVVVDEGSPLHEKLRSEVASRWRISIYEFCSPAEYERQKTGEDSYFLTTVTEDGTVMLLLHKGAGFDVVRMPVCGPDLAPEQLEHLPAYLDIIQRYVLDAMESERVAYSGLKHYNRSKRSIRRTDPAKLVRTVAGSYELIYSAADNELYSIRKVRRGKSS